MTTDVSAVSSAGRDPLPWEVVAARRKIWFAAGFAAGITLTLLLLYALSVLPPSDPDIGRVVRQPALSNVGQTTSPVAGYAGLTYGSVQAHTPDVEWELSARPARWPRQ
jgi:hypothetical protein